MEDGHKKLATQYLEEEANAVGDEGGTDHEAEDTKGSGSFFAKRVKKIDTAKMEVNCFLADQSEELQMVLAYRRIRKVFLKVNCILPTSAPSERLFSRGRLILRHNRMKISDKHFESQLLLCVNRVF